MLKPTHTVLAAVSCGRCASSAPSVPRTHSALRRGDGGATSTPSSISAISGPTKTRWSTAPGRKWTSSFQSAQVHGVGRGQASGVAWRCGVAAWRRVRLLLLLLRLLRLLLRLRCGVLLLFSL